MVKHVDAQTVLEKLTWFSGQEFVDYLVPLRGNRYEGEPKAPIIRWGNREQVPSIDALADHVSKGGWIGFVPKRGYVVVDIDRPEVQHKVLETYGGYYHNFAVSTRRGVHLYFRSSRHDLSGRKPSLLFAEQDMLNHRHYVVAPLFCDEKRWNGVENVREVPPELLVQPSPVVRSLLDGRCITSIKEGDGRNNLLYAATRKIKLYLEGAYGQDTDFSDELFQSMFRINMLFAEPMDIEELDRIFESVMRNEHREDFPYEEAVDGLRNAPTTGGDGFRGSVAGAFASDGATPFAEVASVDVSHNPFAHPQPLSSVASSPQRRWFWTGVCRVGDVVLLCGKPKSGKSTLLRSLVASVVADERQTFSIAERGDVLWYMFEEHPQDVFGGLRLVDTEFPLSFDRIHVVSVSPTLYAQPLTMFLEGFKHYMETASTLPRLVVVDTVGHLLGNKDINDYAVVQTMIEGIRSALRDVENPPTVILVHHTNKSTESVSPLGSQAFSGAVDVIIYLDTDDGGSTIKVVGRGVSPAFHMQSVSLHYDPVLRCYVGADAYHAELSELLFAVESGQLRTVQELRAFRGGVFRAEVRSLLRKGVIKEDGDAVFLDTTHPLYRLLVGQTDNEPILQEKGVNRDAVPQRTEAAMDASVPVTVGLSGGVGDGTQRTVSEEEHTEPEGGYAPEPGDSEGSLRCSGEGVHLRPETRGRTEPSGQTDDVAPIERGGEEMNQETASGVVQPDRVVVPPPMKEAAAELLRLLRYRSGGLLEPSDIDPSSVDDAVSSRVTPTVMSVYRKLKQVAVSDIPTTAIKYEWLEQQGSLVDSLNALRMLLQKFGYSGNYIAFVRRGVGYLAMNLNGRWRIAQVAVDDIRTEELRKRLYESLLYGNTDSVSGIDVLQTFPFTELQKGYMFVKERVIRDGCEVDEYRLLPERYTIRDPNELIKYLETVVSTDTS